MRKYGMWILAIGMVAVLPQSSQGQGLLNKLRKRTAPQVAPQTAAPQGNQNYNQQVAERIANGLRGARLQGYDVEIEFRNGVALLKGEIADAGQKAMATQVASRIPGVTNVDNRLKPRAGAPAPAPSGIQQAGFRPTGAPVIQQVAGTRPAPKTPTAPSNQVVADNLAKALSSAGLKGYDVEIRFQNGVALLEGTVGSSAQAAQAAHLARQVQGVKYVDNRLKMRSTTPRQPVRQVNFAEGDHTYPGIPQANVPPQPGTRVASLPAPPAAPTPAPRYAPPMANPMPTGGVPYGMPSAPMSSPTYTSPNLPEYAYPGYSAYPNYASVTYPTQYSPSAWPYIGPFYPYPQVPLGWRKAALEWDDGSWNLSFNSRTDRWWWFMDPRKWSN